MSIIQDRSFRNFLRQSALFILVLGLLRICIGMFIPYHTGGREISDKIMYLEKCDQRVDLIFLGSSRIRRGVIPTLFDSLRITQNKNKTLSFNLGGPAAKMGENLYLLRNISKNNAGNQVKTVIIEWIEDYLPNPQHYKTERGRYWMDLESFRINTRILKGSPGMIEATKNGKLSYVVSAFLHRSIGLRRISSAWLDTLTPDPTLQTSRGYVGLNIRHAPHIKSGPIVPGKPVYDPLQAGRDRDSALLLHKNPELNPLREDVDLWQDLIQDNAKRGLHLILLIPPGPVSARQLALARQLPTENILDLSDPIQYPDLYDPEIYYDFVHLNHEGAKRFTRHIAAAILQRQSGDRKR